MELLEYWKIIRKRLWLILLLVIAAGAGAAVYSWRQPRQYSATTTLFLSPASNGPVLLPPFQQVQTLANTYTEYMRTQTFASLVAREVNPPISEGAILRAVTTQWVAGTQFFRITVTHSDPQLAQALANSSARVLIDENIARQQAQRRQVEAQNDPAQVLERQRVAELQKTLEAQVTDYRSRVDTLQRQITDLESRPRSTDSDQQIAGLRDTLVKTQAQLVDLLGSQSRIQASLPSANAAGMSADTAVVVDAAPLPTQPLPGKRTQTLIFALLGSLILGLGLALLLEYLQYSVKTPEQLDILLGMPTLGVIGSVKGHQKKPVDAKSIVAFNQPISPTAEAFRALRATLQFPNRAMLRDLVITSAAPHEGKTFVAANLAVSLAQGGRQVILVDADLRRPGLHRVFKVPQAPGLADLILDSGGEARSYLHSTTLSGLWVLPCGSIPSQPAELLNMPRISVIMDQLKQRADVVIYDTPPAAMVMDAMTLAAHTDGVLQVVRAGGVRPELVIRVKEVLERAGGHMVGAVLNQVSLADMGYAGLYYRVSG